MSQAIMTAVAGILLFAATLYFILVGTGEIERRQQRRQNDTEK